MKIAVDLRSLSSGTVSGVENYCTNLLNAMLKLDRVNQYILYYNSFRRQNLPDFQYVNSQIKRARLPSKVLNTALKFKWTSLENLFGSFDWLFLPNLNQFHVSHEAKVAITVHDLSPVVTPEYYDLKRSLWHKFLNYASAFKRADVLFAISESTKNDLVRIFNINPNKIKVVYPGGALNPNSDQLSHAQLRRIRNIYGLPGEYILFLNTIEPRKNLAGLVRAFEKIQSPASLIIAGRLGWKYRKDFEMINKSRKSGKIRYIGYISEQDKPAIIRMAKALVYPSFYEGFGFQALEAMSLGTPVIASHLTSLPEVVGDAGLLINPYDAGNLAAGLDLVLSSKSIRENLIAKGLTKADNFKWEACAHNILTYLKV